MSHSRKPRRKTPLPSHSSPSSPSKAARGRRFCSKFCNIAEGLGPMIKHVRKLSSQLKTRALTFLGEDTSGAIGYDLFENGKELEHADFIDGGEWCNFRSKLR